MLGKHQSKVHEVAPPHPYALIRVCLTSTPFPSCLSPEFLIQQSSGVSHNLSECCCCISLSLPLSSCLCFRHQEVLLVPLSLHSLFFTLFCSHISAYILMTAKIPSRRALPRQETCFLTGHLHSSVSEEPDSVRLQVVHLAPSAQDGVLCWSSHLDKWHHHLSATSAQNLKFTLNSFCSL